MLIREFRVSRFQPDPKRNSVCQLSLWKDEWLWETEISWSLFWILISFSQQSQWLLAHVRDFNDSNQFCLFSGSFGLSSFASLKKNWLFCASRPGNEIQDKSPDVAAPNLLLHICLSKWYLSTTQNLVASSISAYLYYVGPAQIQFKQWLCILEF